MVLSEQNQIARQRWGGQTLSTQKTVYAALFCWSDWKAMPSMEQLWWRLKSPHCYQRLALCICFYIAASGIQCSKEELVFSLRLNMDVQAMRSEKEVTALSESAESAGSLGKCRAQCWPAVFPQTCWEFTASGGLTLSFSKRMRKRQGMGAVAVIRDGGYHF